MSKPSQGHQKLSISAAFEAALKYENQFFALVLGLLALQLWIIFFSVVDLAFYFELHELFSSPFFSMGVTFLSALYLTAVSIILLVPRKPFEQYKTFLPNGVAIFAGFGVYLISFIPSGIANSLSVNIGIGFLTVGVLVVLYALVYLGRAFSVTPHASHLVMGGPYAIVRHPMYIGNIFTMIGLALIFGNIWAYLFCAVFSGLQVIRALYEEALMERTIPDYKHYKARVGGFFPRIHLCRRGLAFLLTVALCIYAAPAHANSEVQCRSWSKTALLGRWFTEQDKRLFDQTDESQLEGPACKAFFKLQDECQSLSFMKAIPEEYYPERPLGEISDKKYAQMQAWVEIEFMKRLGQRRQCLSILGSAYCDDVKKFARASKGKLKSSHKRLLTQCLEPRAGGAGLLRAGL